jgi:large subunit ribosomal protein L23
MGIFGFGNKSKTSQINADKTRIDADKKKTHKDVVVETADNKSELPRREMSKSVKSAQKNEVSKAKTSVADLTGIILRPRITEKASILVEEGNVYTFDIAPGSTTQEVAKAIESHYKVKPIKVNITDIKSKRVFRRGKKGMKSGGKKAMVYLKKSDKIEFV